MAENLSSWTDEDLAYALMEKANAEGEVNAEDLMEVVRQMRDELVARVERLEKKISGMTDELNDVEQTLGKALGYPWYKDDPDSFPGATAFDGVCIGDHTAWSLAEEAVQKIENLKIELIHARDGYMKSLANRNNWKQGERENE